ncbi:MAG: hypothetical protein QOG82_2227 [Actinomycetota bacterium]|jgi:hypothetical protein|nr:hypothetical protein [Actinomycetota bacterium]
MPQSTDDDRLLPATRALAFVIIPVLVAAFTVLFGFPGRTRQLWAWTIRPDLAALIMGGAYVAGAWFFARGLHGGRWHRVAIGWLAVIPFTALLGVATFVHWDRFNHDHVSFWAWLLLYTATPIALPVLWLRNQRAAGPAPAGVGLQLPALPRALTSVLGGALLVAAAVISVRPQTAIGRWPWALTPLTARTLAAFASFLAVVWVAFAFTRDWDRLAIPFEASTLGLVVVAVAVLRGRHDLAGGSRTLVFGLLLGGAIGGSSALLLWAGRHRADTGAAAVASG